MIFALEHSKTRVVPNPKPMIQNTLGSLVCKKRIEPKSWHTKSGLAVQQILLDCDDVCKSKNCFKLEIL